MTCNTPVLLIAWRRPHTTQQVIDAIRAAAPTKLFVACDGPNPERPDEAEKVAATRAVIEKSINWPCQVERLYSDVNQGCRLGVSRAITWFFEQVEEGILLEDDCVPHPDFFPYCEELLERYRDDSRMFSICGSNFQQGHWRGDASYYFSIHGDSWGWATWRRAWSHYEQVESRWFDFRDSGRIKHIFRIPEEQEYWQEIFDELFINHRPNSWAYQWWLAGWMNHGLHAWPNHCLISNVGWDSEGTHTFGSENKFAHLKTDELGNITHPKFILPDRDADDYAFLYRRGGVSIMEREKLGVWYLWKLRLLEMKQKGLVPYIKEKVKKRLKS